MSMYRHLPTVIEAHKFMGEPSMQSMPDEFKSEVTARPSPKIGTIYFLGIHPLRIGTWLIKNDEGEIYPCPDSTFKKSYEVV